MPSQRRGQRSVHDNASAEPSRGRSSGRSRNPATGSWAAVTTRRQSIEQPSPPESRNSAEGIMTALASVTVADQQEPAAASSSDPYPQSAKHDSYWDDFAGELAERRSTPEVDLPPPFFSASRDSLLLQSFGLSKSTAAPGDGFKPIIMAIDCEWLERKPNPLTEIGISTLDTTVIDPAEPGPYGSEWFKQLRCYHFRIREQGHRVNNHCAGDPDGFEFGHTEWLTKEEAKTVMNGFLDVPDRKVVVVFHDPRQDLLRIKACLQIDVLTHGAVHGLMDTQALFGSFEGYAISLRDLMGVLGMRSAKLHNAGNDAAFIALALVRQALRNASFRSLAALRRLRRMSFELCKAVCSVFRYAQALCLAAGFSAFAANA